MTRLPLAKLLLSALLFCAVAAQASSKTWATQPTAWDKDADAIADALELDTYHAGDVAFKLDPLRKDLVVILFHYGSGGLNRLSDASIQLLLDMYATAPVVGADASQKGVRLTLIVPNQGVWFEGEPDDMRSIGAMSKRGNYDWSEYDQLKAVALKALGADALPMFYHCCLSCADYGGSGSSGSSGISRNKSKPYSAFRQGAVDFIASVYGYQSDPESAVMVAGTVAHELGHNLGLTHGGFDHRNYKPNYLSIMNYAFQFEGLVYDGRALVDYQRGDLNEIKPRKVDEAAGLGSNAAGYGTQANIDGAGEPTVFAACDSDVDWNQNGVIDVKPYKLRLTPDYKLKPLKSENNWANVNFSGGGVIPEAEPAAPGSSSAASAASPVRKAVMADYTGRYQELPSALRCPCAPQTVTQRPTAVPRQAFRVMPGKFATVYQTAD